MIFYPILLVENKTGGYRHVTTYCLFRGHTVSAFWEEN